MYIPNCNSIIDYQTGDGFKSILGSLLRSDDILICSNKAIVNQYKNSCAQVVTLPTLHKIPEKNCYKQQWRRIILDCRLPRPGTKSLRALHSLVADRTITFTRAPHDTTAMCTALYLLSNTHTKYFKVVKWNKFMHESPRYARHC